MSRTLYRFRVDFERPFKSVTWYAESPDNWTGLDDNKRAAVYYSNTEHEPGWVGEEQITAAGWQTARHGSRIAAEEETEERLTAEGWTVERRPEALPLALRRQP